MLEAYLIPMGTGLVYVLEAFILLWLAKMAYTGIYRRVDVKAELFERGNAALAVSLTGYLFGVVLAFGGVLADSGGSLAGFEVVWKSSLTSVALYGIGAIVMMLLASFLCEKILLPHFDNTREVIDDHSLGTAFVEAGMHIGNGLIVLAITQGQGPWWVGPIFWLLAQVVLIITGLLYEWVTPHKMHEELHRNNAAVGLAFGGALVGMGNIVSMAVSGDFLGWKDSLIGFAAYAVFGLVLLFLIKKLTDWLLAPGVNLGEEQARETPNLGAGLLEAFGYIGGSMLILWSLG